MKKRKRKKILFKRVLSLLFIISIVFISFYIITTTNSDNYKLKKLGYNEDERKEILKNKDITLYLLNHDYNDLYLKFINTKDYEFKNLDSYINYYENNNGVSFEDTIYLVNNNINESYSKNLIQIVKHKYFIKDRLKRYLNYLNKTNKNIDDIITNVNSNIDYDFYTNINASDTSKNYLLIANKFYKLENNYKHSNLVTMENDYTKVSGAKLEKTTYEAFKQLSDDARKQGYYIVNTSAYRSYESQNYIYNNYKREHGLNWADSYSARPGHSEHQTGLALDVGSAKTTLSTFEQTKEFTWMKDNAHKYGFILRYPKGKEYITGYSYEPWHYRYIGRDEATFIYENNLTFEEYYAYYIEKK